MVYSKSPRTLPLDNPIAEEEKTEGGSPSFDDEVFGPPTNRSHTNAGTAPRSQA